MDFMILVKLKSNKRKRALVTRQSPVLSVVLVLLRNGVDRGVQDVASKHRVMDALAAVVSKQ